VAGTGQRLSETRLRDLRPGRAQCELGSFREVAGEDGAGRRRVVVIALPDPDIQQALAKQCHGGWLKQNKNFLAEAKARFSALVSGGSFFVARTARSR
jgi:hypothetical protein